MFSALTKLIHRYATQLRRQIPLARSTYFLLLIIGHASAQAPSEEIGRQTIERRGTPMAMQDFDPYANQRFNPWFDRGSWHGFLLPESVEDRGGFNGPMIVAEEYGVFLARAFDVIDVFDVTQQRMLTKADAQWQIRAEGGSLHQNLRWPDLSLGLELRFVSSHTALIQIRVHNHTQNRRTIQLRWHGSLLDQWQTQDSAKAEKKVQIARFDAKFPHWSRTLRADAYALYVDLGRVRAPSELMISGSGSYWITRQLPSQTHIQGLSYTSTSDDIQVPPDGDFTTYTAHHYALDQQDRQQAESSVKSSMAHVQNQWRAAEQSWHARSQSARSALQKKAMETLVNNWRRPAGALRFDGVVPSTTSRWFNCMWAWDSFKQAYALSDFDPNLAKQQMRLMLSVQISAQDPIRPQDAGMIIDDVCYNQDPIRGGDGYNWNERNTKPPLASWASWKIYQTTRDRAWLKEVYPKLKAFHQWWYTHRDTNKNGLVEFGATRHPEHNDENGALKFFIKSDAPSWNQRCEKSASLGLVCYSIELYRQAQKEGLAPIAPAQEATGYESGMDNAARFGFIEDNQLADYAKLHHGGDLKAARQDWQVDFFENRATSSHGNDGIHGKQGELLGYSMNQESVDLNAFLYADKLYLAKMAQVLGLQSDARQWRQQARSLKQKINQCFFDASTGYFYDRKILSQQADATACGGGLLLTQRGRGSEAFAVLWAGAATPQHARRTMQHWLAPQEFASYLAFPTAALSNPAFHPTSYWRGRVWLDQVYFALKGMQHYGEGNAARRIAQQVIDRAVGVTQIAPFRENYHPLTGEGQGPANFSWTAAHFWMIERELLQHLESN
ncbi:alpha-glucosidase [Undibacterium cyanobacteriorum]|uniref:Alpha-glucosidase n=1 Tax=Undibacterium cyanobacteriorum TaxID=3073561 RepID=A0ABY9RJ61_9BURK|nr:alpha-glucosidase [Undibacterium sp. 20NA77.5]WMW80320.1 alpha-glucosidase [Undibacterium sp. 20NA77.5]